VRKFFKVGLMFLDMSYNEIKDFVLEVVSNKKYQWAATIVVFFAILMLSSSIRLSNWDLFTDRTTGGMIPGDLDSYYFLRIAETLVETNGNIGEIDYMRVPGFNVEWTYEISPQVIVWMWKASSIFGDYSLRTINVFSPVFFFGVALILFFLLTYVLTKSKTASILSCTFLAFVPAYLFRTLAGSSDHDAIGMMGFFAVMLAFALAMKYLDGAKKKNLIGAVVAGIIVGGITDASILFWGGVGAFIFMIIPISFFALWIIKLQKPDSDFKDTGLLFYSAWLISSVLFILPSRILPSFFIQRYLLGPSSIISVAVLAFIIVDRLIIYFSKYMKSRYNEKHRIYYVISVLIILGIILLPLIKMNFFEIVWITLNKMVNPSWVGSGDGGRHGFTVAENSQMYLSDLIGGVGVQLFWLFFLGLVMMGIEFAKKIKSRKNRYLLIVGFVAMMSGILFTRISPSSILSGEDFISLGGLLYLSGLVFFAYAFLKSYNDGRIEIDSSILILSAWAIVTLITARSSIRMLFFITPFICLSSAYFIAKIFEYYKKNRFEEISGVILIGVLIVSVVVGGTSIYGSYLLISDQARHTGPSADWQWQGAMSWIRNNTDTSAVFSHWWDYGYWVQTLGGRATVADGGQIQTIYDGNHKIGRYVLTTPQPETALSFFKTMDVDYLLIDQTDLGKYPAYSRIGSGPDGVDRYAAIPVMPNDPKQTVETANGTMIVFSGGMYLFEDINYNMNGKDIFLPAEKAAVVGVIMNIEGNSLRQPQAVYIYNNIQTRIPVRYVYVNGGLIDFGSGLDVVIDIIPAFTGNSINQMGAAIYLSQTVSKSLFARLFLLDDAFGEYETLELVHTEDDPVVASLKAQGVPLGDFVYYQGFRGPIKIWDVSEIPEGIKVVPEFKEASTGEYGSLDDLDFGNRD